ncbi:MULTISPECIES: FMN-binding negative transcriptional regulator [Aequorivita]|uniref:FMN-binding negative transcriptional regulator n=2 Tax=Aequorivita TaxID=153265 RepID=A0AB35YZD4_9FLAO|nr:FMN-binding negative transcriptional regulator [Aequorivita sp. Ant34-E75]WGF91371.1 FMN-binding negative transcriptional regulator [Aequorivita sp. Ant34-E75]
MHIPNYFKNENLEEVKNFLIQNSFGILINRTEERLTGTHIPMEIDKNEYGEDVLVGHVSKANPQWENFNDKEEILAIFNGPHAYVSSSWYEKENVPTWNYIAVHVYGEIRIIEGDELLDSLRKLVNKHERNSENPVSVENMSSETLKQINGIVGFSIKINEIQAAYKLSQNRNQTDYHTIIEKLEKNGNPISDEVVTEMKKKSINCKLRR